MTPPRVCPPPQAPDCPLYEQRVVHYSPSETLRRAILTERHGTPDLAGLVRAEPSAANPPQAALPPGQPTWVPSILDQLQEKSR